MATGDLDPFSLGSEEVYTLVCLPCQRDDTKRPAQGYCIDCKEHLCQECVNHHRKPAPCRQHKLQGKNTMPSTQHLTNTPVHTGTTDQLTTPCPHHNTEMITHYCHDHEMFLCSICVCMKHAKRCHCDYIPDISDKMINSRDYKHTIERIDKILRKCTTIKTQTSRNSNKSTDSLQDAMRELKHYRKQINERINQLEKDIEAEIQSIQYQKDEQRTTVTTLCEDIMKVINATYCCIKQFNTSNQANHLFMKVKQAQKQLQYYEGSIKSLSADDSFDEYKFVSNQAINDVLQKEKTIGDISTKHHPIAGSSSKRRILPSSGDGTITPTCLGEICVKSSVDKYKCWITGMAVLAQDRLVLADLYNNSIKLVDVNCKSIISQLSLGTKSTDAPWDITSTTSTQVAVTIPLRQHIQFISVSNKLSKSHTIQTDSGCWGICCHQDKLIVTYQDTGKFEILDMRGRVITRVTTDSTGTDIVPRPVYVQANSRSIYVSDWEDNMVSIWNWNSEITGRITDIGSPRGLTLLQNGSLLVCDKGNDNVYQVAGGVTNSKIILQDVRRPQAVCADDEGHKLYISRRTAGDKPDSNILIYSMSSTVVETLV